MKVKTKQDYRKRRHLRLRQKICGTADRPRMSVYKSNRNLTVQCIDDLDGETVASCSTLEKDFSGSVDRDAAKQVGRAISERLKGKDVDTVVFDSGGFGYAGKIEEMAEAAREAGLKF